MFLRLQNLGLRALKMATSNKSNQPGEAEGGGEGEDEGEGWGGVEWSAGGRRGSLAGGGSSPSIYRIPASTNVKEEFVSRNVCTHHTGSQTGEGDVSTQRRDEKAEGE